MSRLAVAGRHASTSAIRAATSARAARRFPPGSSSRRSASASPAGRARTRTWADALGEPVSAVPATGDAALSDAGWWLAEPPRRADRRPHHRPERLPRAGAGATARGRARVGAAFTEYDGWVPAAGPRLDPAAPGRVVSATTLERLAGCPFRHFLERGLGSRRRDDAEPDPDAWLDPRRAARSSTTSTRGSAREQRSAESGRPAPRRATPRARRGRLLTASRARCRRRPIDVFERERVALLRDLDLLLDLEARGPEPHARRLRGDRSAASRDDDEPLARAEPVTATSAPGSAPAARPDRPDRPPAPTAATR